MKWFSGQATIWTLGALAGAACTVTSGGNDAAGGSGGQTNSAGAPAAGGTTPSSGGSAGRSSGGSGGTSGDTSPGAGEPGEAGEGGVSSGGSTARGGSAGKGGTHSGSGATGGGETSGGAGEPATGGTAGASDEGGAAGVSGTGGTAGVSGTGGTGATGGTDGGTWCGAATPEVPQSGTSVKSGAAAPTIDNVYVSRIGQDLHVELDGSGFGNAPRTLPVVYDLTQFSITDVTQGSWSAGGNGSPVYLQYTSWTDSRIVIDGFGSQYGGQYKLSVGDTVSIYVQSTAAGAAGASTTWTGTLKSTPPPPLDPDGPTPQVCTATFNEIGQNMQIVLDGAGFGTAPRTLPVVYDLTELSFTDVTQGGWSAGGNGSPVYLQFASWTDSRIVIDGFGSQYGTTYKVVDGDQVSIFVQNSAGPEFTVWTGALKESPRQPNSFDPIVQNVTFTNVGAGMHIEVDGSGFGTAPRTLPVTYDLTQFAFTDITQGGWSAGGNGSPVYLQYTSWTDTKIVIDGFGTQYGTTYTVADGDQISLFIQNSAGPEFTVWSGELP